MNQNSDALGVFVKAAAFSDGKHRSQRRKYVDGSPSINHSIALANEGGITGSSAPLRTRVQFRKLIWCRVPSHHQLP